MKSFQLKRIIWAVDPLDPEGNSHQTITAILKQFEDLGNIEIQPVYVSKAEPFLVPLEEAAQFALKQFVEGTHLRMLEPKVMRCETHSIKDTVDVLIAYAKETNSDLIVTQTHGRHGLRRVFLGSFAETLLLRSPVPVLIMNPNIVTSPKFQKILFPTDFDRHAVRLFREVVGFAKLTGSRIILFHVIPTLTAPYTGAADIVLTRQYESLVRDFIRKQKDRASRRSRVWTKFAAKQGVPVEFVIENDGYSLWEVMLKAAKKYKVKLIALETERGPKESAVFGSITRNLARYADCPIWVLRSHYSEQLSQQVSPKARAA